MGNSSWFNIFVWFLNLHKAQTGCGFLDWFYEEVKDEKNQLIMKQKLRLEKLTKENEAYG